MVEHRTLETDEKEMIESIFQFGGAEVRDVLIPVPTSSASPMTCPSRGRLPRP